MATERAFIRALTAEYISSGFSAERSAAAAQRAVARTTDGTNGIADIPTSQVRRVARTWLDNDGRRGLTLGDAARRIGATRTSRSASSARASRTSGS